MLEAMKSAARRVTLEVVGWTLVVAGIAALILPGPGLLMLFAGMAVLSQQYDWAAKRLAPVKYRAMRGAADGVATWPRIIGSTLAALFVAGLGVLWIVGPEAPRWWFLDETWWLAGGVAFGITQVLSAGIALGLIVWSYRRFHGKPEAIDDLERDIQRADSDHETSSHR
ncbi:hypothetical protein NOK12_08740 [Nocardioides sp. OK12]|nr:hypothetical protein NOK12_08740 [Nocardioides sp. OK12]